MKLCGKDNTPLYDSVNPICSQAMYVKGIFAHTFAGTCDFCKPSLHSSVSVNKKLLKISAFPSSIQK